MTLNESWERCLKMWRWIGAQIRNGDVCSVDVLKEDYIEIFDPGAEGTCYFCEYDTEHCNEEGCSQCPGRLVDLLFYCDKEGYHYWREPLAFLAKIEELNKIRLSGEEK